MIDIWLLVGCECKLVGESAKRFPIWQVIFLEGPMRSATGGWARLVDAIGHIQKTILPVNILKLLGAEGG
jgi:hypothetical protein